MKLYDITNWNYRGKVTDYPLIAEINTSNAIDLFEIIEYGGKYYSVRTYSTEANYVGVELCEAPNLEPEEKWGENEITCPYCGYEHSDSWEAYDSDDEYECGNCGAIFSYERIVDVTYTSRPVKPPKIIKVEATELESIQN